MVSSCGGLRDIFVMLPGGVLVVEGSGLDAAVLDAYEPICQLPERGVVTDVAGAHRVVVGPGAA